MSDKRNKRATQVAGARVRYKRCSFNPSLDMLWSERWSVHRVGGKKDGIYIGEVRNAGGNKRRLWGWQGVDLGGGKASGFRTRERAVAWLMFRMNTAGNKEGG